jgi:NDP-hexose 3,5-(Or5-) epimerase
MEISELALAHCYRLTPTLHRDARGAFYEQVRHDVLAEVGIPFTVAQVNYSTSRKNTLRGIHGVALPPGQAKIVSCVRGGMLDMVIDLRLGSPTYGQFEVNRLDAESGIAMYLAEGLGHAFLSLTADCCVSYLCSTEHQPGRPFDVNPLDPALDLPWGLASEPLMSEKDRTAPTLAEAEAAGLLPSYAECLALYAKHRGAS